MDTTLCPAQQRAYDALTQFWPVGRVFTLSGDRGMGRTTVLRKLHAAVGGAFLSARELADALAGRDPLALEEAFDRLLRDTLAGHDHVFLDDAHLLFDVVRGGCNSYPRPGLIDLPLEALAAHAVAAGKKLVVGSDGPTPPALAERDYATGIPDFEVADYEFLGRALLPADAAGRLNYAKIHRFAPNLNGHQWAGVCAWLGREPALDTDRFIDYLRSRHMASNVDLDEVQPIRLEDLHGVDDVIAALDTHIIRPLENDELAERYSLRPKRGVLLAGPPGTGKTTVGRALAHRLKSKFFLVDGTCISGTEHFYYQIHRIFAEARRNAPSVIFVDDSDVIFEGGSELGLYRYLLTMLDGLESASNGRVCVMLTAMEVSHLPPALLRSGRVELWLEMKLPDDRARAAILRQYLDGLPPPMDEVELPKVVAATAGLVGADLKRLVDDGKNLLAAELVAGRRPEPLTDYLLLAVAELQASKGRYAAADQEARKQRPQRPVYFDAAVG